MNSKVLYSLHEKPFESYSDAFSGNVSCMSVSYRANTWIVDFGATDPMKYWSLLFHSYTPSPSNTKISIANDSLATVA